MCVLAIALHVIEPIHVYILYTILYYMYIVSCFHLRQVCTESQHPAGCGVLPGQVLV